MSNTETLGIDLTELLGDIGGMSAAELVAGAERNVRGAGKTGVLLTGAVSRELTLEDVQNVGVAQVGVSSASPLKKLRDRHHRVAQLLAKGYFPQQIASITGYSISRISILQQDESFAELVSSYRERSNLIFTETVEKMKALTDDAVEVLQERLEDNPDSFTNGMLIEAVKTIGDRAGFSPVQKSLSVNATLPSDQISALKAKVAERSLGQVRRITQEVANAEYQTIQSVEGVEVGAIDGSAQPLLQSPEAQGE